MLLPGRHGEENTAEYRYGFNGKEADDEVKGKGNSYDFGARIHDPRIGRFLSLDPKSATYPFMSPYCYAANSPILFIDENGEGPRRPKNGYVTTIISSWGEHFLNALLTSNNASVALFEEWSFGMSNHRNKIIGAMGEAVFAKKMGDAVDNADVVYKTFEYQSRVTNGSRPDIVSKITVGQTSTFLGYTFLTYTWRYHHPFYNSEGERNTETYYEDAWPTRYGQIKSDFETYTFQYEIKTLKPANWYHNISNLRKGMYQVLTRMDDSNASNPVGVLVTDYDAYMNIVRKANSGNQRAENFIEQVDDFIDDGGQLFLMQDLYNSANRAAYGMRDEIRERRKTLKEAAKNKKSYKF